MGAALCFGAICFLCGWWARGLAAALPALHRAAFRRRWAWASRRRGSGRPRLDPDLIALIVRISAENPLWGAPGIHGELLKLGYRLAQSSVSKHMLPRRGRPGRSWANFLANQAGAICVACSRITPLITMPTACIWRSVTFPPLGRRTETRGRIVSRPVLGGLHRRYGRKTR